MRTPVGMFDVATFVKMSISVDGVPLKGTAIETLVEVVTWYAAQRGAECTGLRHVAAHLATRWEEVEDPRRDHGYVDFVVDLDKLLLDKDQPEHFVQPDLADWNSSFPHFLKTLTTLSNNGGLDWL